MERSEATGVRGFSAYASESDIHSAGGSIFIPHLIFHLKNCRFSECFVLANPYIFWGFYLIQGSGSFIRHAREGGYPGFAVPNFLDSPPSQE